MLAWLPTGQAAPASPLMYRVLAALVLLEPWLAAQAQAPAPGPGGVGFCGSACAQAQRQALITILGSASGPGWMPDEVAPDGSVTNSSLPWPPAIQALGGKAPPRRPFIPPSASWPVHCDWNGCAGRQRAASQA